MVHYLLCTRPKSGVYSFWTPFDCRECSNFKSPSATTWETFGFPSIFCTINENLANCIFSLGYNAYIYLSQNFINLDSFPLYKLYQWKSFRIYTDFFFCIFLQFSDSYSSCEPHWKHWNSLTHFRRKNFQSWTAPNINQFDANKQRNRRKFEPFRKKVIKVSVKRKSKRNKLEIILQCQITPSQVILNKIVKLFPSHQEDRMRWLKPLNSIRI
jgi:hypothetical protein